MKSARPPVSREMRTNASAIVSPAAWACAAREVCRVGGIVDGPWGEHVDAFPLERRSVLAGNPEQLGPAAGIIEHREACLERQRRERRPFRSPVEERAVLQSEEQTNAASSRLGPELAAERGFLVDQLEDLAEQLGSRVALRETERDRSTGAAIDLRHPVHLGARVLVVRSRSFEARRDFEHALAVPAEHVADREELAFVGPRPRNRSAVRNTMEQRA